MNRKKRIILLVLSFLAIGFGLLSVLVLVFPNSLLDIEFSEEVQEHHNPVLDNLMEWISFPGYSPYSIIIVVLTSLIFLCFKYRREALYVLLTLHAGMVSFLLKILIKRPRPAETAVRIVEKAKHQSFPSGHVLFYVVFFGFLVLLMNHLKSLPRLIRGPVSLISLIFIFTVPISRVYLGAHWFTDVTAGFLVCLIRLYVMAHFYLRLTLNR